jgi:hypothetical protein
MTSTSDTSMSFENKRLLGIVAAIAFLLLIPVAIKAPWSGFDFMAAGVLLFGTGIAIELALRLVKGLWARVAVCAVLLLVLLVVWAEVGIGVFGTRFSGS